MYQFYLIDFEEVIFDYIERRQILAAAKMLQKEFSMVTLYLPVYFGENKFRFMPRNFRTEAIRKIKEVNPLKIIRFSIEQKQDYRDWEHCAVWKWFCQQFLKAEAPKWITHECPITRQFANIMLEEKMQEYLKNYLI